MRILSQPSQETEYRVQMSPLFRIGAMFVNPSSIANATAADYHMDSMNSQNTPINNMGGTQLRTTDISDIGDGASSKIYTVIDSTVNGVLTAFLFPWWVNSGTVNTPSINLLITIDGIRYKYSFVKGDTYFGMMVLFNCLGPNLVRTAFVPANTASAVNMGIPYKTIKAEIEFVNCVSTDIFINSNGGARVFHRNTNLDGSISGRNSNTSMSQSGGVNTLKSARFD